MARVIARGHSSGVSIERRIVELLRQRAAGATICPSDVLSGDEKQDAARMNEVRAVARRLVRRGVIDIVQRGAVVDPDDFRGPIRLRLR